MSPLCLTPFSKWLGWQVHDKDFVMRFSSGSLSASELRRIGFGEVTCHPDLIERTKAEVAGCMLHTFNVDLEQKCRIQPLKTPKP